MCPKHSSALKLPTRNKKQAGREGLRAIIIALTYTLFKMLVLVSDLILKPCDRMGLIITVLWLLFIHLVQLTHVQADPSYRKLPPQGKTEAKILFFLLV